jgi:hypothetical protein
MAIVTSQRSCFRERGYQENGEKSISEPSIKGAEIEAETGLQTLLVNVFRLRRKFPAEMRLGIFPEARPLLQSPGRGSDKCRM